ncbi:MAG TPA: CehA/McbA family metallohydrolase [Actinomycetota bacterium]|nr:CehA/McbA family metallohydrolase [Actinomycetota bacterium]
MRPPSERLEQPDAWGTSRASRLFPGWWLAHGDLHNHTQLSDGAGDPRLAFPSLRAAGLDVAALTDHSRWASLFLDLAKAPGWTGIDGRAWRLTNDLAEAANADGEFVALHGFEWSHAAYGHMNVWNSERFTDPLRTVPTMGRFWRWLETRGEDGLAGFNHPGTGRLRFGGFGYRPAMAHRLVSLELFNKLEDYLLKDTDRGLESPLNQCLNAGWRVGLLGVTDEHGPDWGHPDGKGRAGLWLRELTRAGVLEALAARRFYASRVKGLRLDAALTSLAGAGGGAGAAARARMGTAVAHPGGPVRIEVDLDRGQAWEGRRLGLQVLRPGERLPAQAAALEVALPGPTGPLVSLELDLDPADGAWVVLRVTDPAEPPDPRATGDWAGQGRAIAYASPFWLDRPS